MLVPPAFLISGVYMPEMSGVKLAMKLVERWPECKVLLFSVHATTDDLTEARAAGHDFPLLAKPVHPAEIIRHLSNHLDMPVKAIQGAETRSFRANSGNGRDHATLAKAPTWRNLFSSPCESLIGGD
jgi:DNA-binding NtrC family response regulator